MKILLQSAKRRAKKANIPFSITEAELFVPKICPVLGIPIFVSESGNMGPNSPTIDKIIPEKGYIKNNVVIISAKANTIKSNATIEEIEMVYKYYKEKL